MTTMGKYTLRVSLWVSMPLANARLLRSFLPRNDPTFKFLEMPLKIGALVMIVVGCQPKENPAGGEAGFSAPNIVTLSASQLASSGVAMGGFKKMQMSSIVKATGIVEVPPQNIVSVSVPLGGYLKSTKLLPGLQLKKGELIAVLEGQEYIQLQEDYLVTKAGLEVAETEYLRQYELNQSKASSDKVLQQARGGFQSLKIKLRALGQKLLLININPQTLNEENLSNRINLYAPFDGFVSKVNVNIGKYITPSDVMFELINPEDIHLNLKVFEKDLIRLSIGQKLVAYTNSSPTLRHSCEIILISRDILLDRTAEVHCHFEDYDKSLIPGMYMNAEIEVNGSEVMAILEKAIVNFQGVDYLFVAHPDGTFEMIEAVVGEIENGWAEIRNSSTFGESKIVTQGAYVLLMSLKNKSEE